MRGKVGMHVHVGDRLASLRGGGEEETGKNSDGGKGFHDRGVCHEAHEVHSREKHRTAGSGGGEVISHWRYTWRHVPEDLHREP